MLAVLDWLLTVVHVGVVLAVLLLWIPRATWRWHYRLVALVAFSWLVIGLYKGALGYCFLTDMHWRVKHARGVGRLPGSFLKYMADSISGTDVAPRLVDAIAGAAFVGICLAAIFRFWQLRRAS